MKKTLSCLGAFLLAAATVLTPILGVGTGCATFQNTDRWATVAKIAARRGTYETLRAHPEYRPAFEAAVEALDQLVLSDAVNYDGLLAALRKLPIKELKGDSGGLLVQDAIDLYDALIGDSIRLKDDSRLRPIAVSLRDGVRAGLAMEPGAVP